MVLAVRISSYGCTWEVWRALKNLELPSAAPRATLTLLSCSPNFPGASITRYTHAKHEPILKQLFSNGKRDHFFFLRGKAECIIFEDVDTEVKLEETFKVPVRRKLTSIFSAFFRTE